MKAVATFRVRQDETKALPSGPVRSTNGSSPTAQSVGSTTEDEAPWPTDESAEASFLASARDAGGVAPTAAAPVVVAARDEVEDSKAPLPSLDSLVQRIPEEVRETLEELFRAKFTTVRRVPAKVLDQRPS